MKVRIVQIVIFGLVLVGGIAISWFLSSAHMDYEYMSENNEEQQFISTDLDVDWEQATTDNYTYRIEYSCYGYDLSVEECKEQYEDRKELIEMYQQTESDCNKYEKLSYEKWGQGTQEYPYIFIDRCVPLSDDEIILKKIESLEQRVEELEQHNLIGDVQKENEN